MGLKDNSPFAEHLIRQLSQLPGVKEIQPCIRTGRIMVSFHPETLSVEKVCEALKELEQAAGLLEKDFSSHDSSHHSLEPSPEGWAESAGVGEAAATKHAEPESEETMVEKEEGKPKSNSFPFPIQIPEDFRNVLDREPEANSNRIPWGLGIAASGLVALGAKQLFFGKSSLAYSPVIFAASGILSVITGYPFLKRGVKEFSEKRKWNADLILGTAALGLGLVRENLLVLAGLTVLQYIHWKRSQAELTDLPNEKDDAFLTPAIQKYSNNMGKWAFPLAGATWALTRDPLKGLAVLLAMNPRPAIIPAIAAWKQAERQCAEDGGFIPKNGTLAQCARVQTLLVEDTAQLFDPSMPELKILSHDEDEDRVCCLAASLVSKAEHPFKEQILQKAKRSKRTMRTAFDVQAEADGITGIIHQSTVYFGNLKYMQKHKLNVDPYLLKLKRMEKNGTECYALVRKNDAQCECLGIIYQEYHPPTGAFLSLNKRLQQAGRKIAVLRNSLGLDPHILETHQVDTAWLLLDEAEQAKQIQIHRQQGEEFLFLPNGNTGNDLELPTLSEEQLKRLPSVLKLADQVQEKIDQQFRITKWFNLAGVAMAIPFRMSAMLINLMADALSLIFLSRIKEPKLSPVSLGTEAELAMAEIAAASAVVEHQPVWHTLAPEEVKHHFGVNEQMGLNPHQVEELQKTYGLNQLVYASSKPWWKTYLGQFKEFSSLLLLGTSALSFFTGDAFNGIAVTLVLLMNAAVGTIQERKAEKVVEALNQYQAPFCTVIREGKEQVIDGKELVPGDLVLLEAGDRVPADIRLIESWNLEVDESMLTGESLPVAKNPEPIRSDSPLSERSNTLFKGTGVSRGRALGIVVSTGMRTEMGHLMSLMQGKEEETTPLQKEVSRISKTFVKGALVIAGIILIIGLLRGNNLLAMIPTSIALAASAIPEGLPVTVTIALSAGIFRMAKKNTLVRKLSTLETLGRATVICTDKTGTLTKNEMTVKHAATLGNEWQATGEGYAPTGELIAQNPVTDGDKKDLAKLVKVATLCNNTQLYEEDGQWKITGDPTEGALLAFAHKAGMSPRQGEWHRVHEVPFDSATAKMSVVCKENGGQEKRCFVLTKGAVESIFKHCSFAQKNGEIIPFTDEHKQKILETAETWAKKSLRVLAFSYRPVDWDGNQDGIENDSIFIGIVGMMDPPKAGIENSIREAYFLGAKPVMITGDHPLTAYTIAKEIGISEDPVVMTGQELDKLSDEELIQRIEDISVFARVTPEHKLRIVRIYQRLGHVVAMTGDGVNDTPAIKQADVGIAMGQTGTDVTKETADMILQKDHFGSIVDGVKEGRTIVCNIRKALGCLLTGNLAEILVTGIAVIAGLPLPLIPLQILLMNLLTDALPAMVLAMNPGSKAKHTHRSQLADRDLYSKVLLRGAILGLGSLGLFVTSLAAGASLPVAQTIAFAALVTGQLIQTFSWRQEDSGEKTTDWMKDRYLLMALGTSALALVSTIYLPPLSSFFHTAPLAWADWIKILLVTGSVTSLSKPILSLYRRRREMSLSVPVAQAA